MLGIDTIQLHSAVNSSLEGGGRIDLVPYTALNLEPANPHSAASIPNEYCFFLKPELATLGLSAFMLATDIVFALLREFEQQVVACAVLSGRYLERYDLMERHYSVINRSSRLGHKALSSEGLARLAAMLDKTDINPLEVFGGHEFLAEFDFFTPQALCVLHDSLSSTKLDPGAYAVRAIIEGQQVAIINGFHPLQLAWFYRPASAIIVFVIRTPTTWRRMRRDLIGPTNPALAPSATMRGRLMAASSELGFQVSALRNGVHASAGPLEAAVEIARYMSRLDASTRIDLTETTFGHFAVDQLGVDDFRRAAMNPVVRVGAKAASTFDLTEEVEPLEAIRMLRQCAFSVSG